MTTDPLAGKREAINRDELRVLVYDGSLPCPVESGQTFILRACSIRIETPQRHLKNGKAEWHVRYVRLEQDVPRILRWAPPAHADKHKDLDQWGNVKTPTDYSIKQAAEVSAYTSTTHEASPGEPESVTRAEQEEITARAHHLFGASRQQETNRRKLRSASNQLRELQARATRAGVDLGPTIEAVESVIEAGKRKVDEAA